MNILWCVNILLPDAAKALGLPSTPFGGWMVSLSAELAKTQGIKLAIAAVYPGKEVKKVEANNIVYYLIPGGHRSMLQKPNQRQIGCWREVARAFQPDLLHLHGTEYPHGLALLAASPDAPSVVSIQGLLGVYEKYYFAGMECPDVFLRPSLRDIIRLDPLWCQRAAFRKRAVFEREILCKVKHAIGRTTWDFANTKAINPDIRYHHCDESLREPFYNHAWDLAKVQRHSIFTTQAGYPIKGLHQLIKALAIVKTSYPDVMLFVSGVNLPGRSKLEQLKITGYALYVKRLIKNLDLHDNIEFTGLLDADGVVNRLLQSHVFVIPSAVENSPNSLGEAMLMGVPSIAAFSGGMPDMMTHNASGFMYPFMEEAILAEYIRRIFESDHLAVQFSAAGRESARQRHDRKKITDTMLRIYSEIVSYGS